jgi:methylmalonyl-CoA/ethylmalonyl-CoA epimerase
MIIDHIGVAVASLEQGIMRWERMFGYKQISPIVYNSRQKVKVVFLDKDGSVCVKLVEPSGSDSPIASFVRKGGGLHHLCIRCNGLEDALPLMKQAGARILVDPQPGEAFRGHNIAFCLVPGNLNIEMIDTTDKTLFDTPDQYAGSA